MDFKSPQQTGTKIPIVEECMIGKRLKWFLTLQAIENKFMLKFMPASYDNIKACPFIRVSSRKSLVYIFECNGLKF